MAFILRSSKYVCNFLGFARRASLTYKRKKVLLLEYNNFFKLNQLQARAAATLSLKPEPSNHFSIDKNISNLHNNLKANMVDLYTVEVTFSLLKENGVITPSQLILLLKCCGSAAFRDSEARRINMAKKIWEAAEQLGTELDISHYNSLLGVFVENSYKFSPQEMLSEIEKAGLEPNRVTFRHLLKAYCQQGNIQGAGNMLETIKEKNYPINEYDFCSLIQGHCEAGELEEAAKIFTVMKDRGIKPSLQPYVYLLCGYAKHGNIKKMEELLAELSKLEIPMSDSHLLNIVYTLIVNNQGEHVDSLLARMKGCHDYEKTLMKVIHRLLHKHKDDEALKLFGILSKMNYHTDYIRDQAHSLVEHFVFNRSPSEVSAVCQKLQSEGWTPVACSHALKKAVLRMDLDFCASFMQNLKKNGFPLRSHYFWPLMVRLSDRGNSGVLSVMKAMKSLGVLPCYTTVKTYIRDHYKFNENWKSEIDVLKKNGAKECHLSLIAINEVLSLGDIKSAEIIASSYGVFKPGRNTINLLIQCFAKSCSHEEEKFINTAYYLAHDCFIYNSAVTLDAGDCEEEKELTGLNTFFDELFSSLMANCAQDVFLSVLQNASKKKVMISPETASLIRKNFTNCDVNALLKDFTDSSEFELNQDLLKLKSENATVIPKLIDRSGILNLSNKNDMRAEKLWVELGPKASFDDNLAMVSMYSRMKLFDKAFDVIERMKDVSENYSEDLSSRRKFRVALHFLQSSKDVEKMIGAYEVGCRLGLINEEQVTPVLRTILQSYEINEAMEKYPQFFEKVRTVAAFLDVMVHVIPSKSSETIKKLTESFSRETNKNAALTTLFTAYVAHGCKEEAQQLLEGSPFNFQHQVFLFWFRKEFNFSEKTFEDVMEILKILGSVDRTPIYEFLLSKYERAREYEKIKLLWLQCQEDNVTDPFFLERLRRSMLPPGKNADASDVGLQQDDSSNSGKRWLEEKELRKVQEMLKMNKYSEETLEKLLAGNLPTRIARQMLPILAAEGKCLELVHIVNKYRFGRFLPEIASEMLQKGKVEEYLEFVKEQASMKKYSGVYNCFAMQQDRVLDLVKSNEKFFKKFLELSLRCYEEGKYEALLVFFIKVCVHLPDKLSKAEELLSTEDGRIVSHFRNYALSNMLLSSAEEVDFYKNVLGSEKVKSVFSEALDHFYERVINFYNEKNDLGSALSYLEKAKADGVEGKLSKRLMSSIKKNLENKGSSFPYPELLQEAA